MGKSTPHQRDVYYRKAKEEGYRARSAYKLLQLDEMFHFLDPEKVNSAVDLCAAPGSWSQVLVKRLNAGKSKKKRTKIVSVDIQAMAPIDGVHQVLGDITRKDTAEEVIAACGGVKADLVVCDGAPDITGLHELDEYFHGELMLNATNIMMDILRPGGLFIAKIFVASEVDFLEAQLRVVFKTVERFKPDSSRASSAESFIICHGYLAPKWRPLDILNPDPTVRAKAEEGLTEFEVWQARFSAQGDLSGFKPHLVKPIFDPKDLQPRLDKFWELHPELREEYEPYILDSSKEEEVLQELMEEYSVDASVDPEKAEEERRADLMRQMAEAVAILKVAPTAEDMAQESPL